jgi:hypothetical protein
LPVGTTHPTNDDCADVFCIYFADRPTAILKKTAKLLNREFKSMLASPDRPAAAKIPAKHPDPIVQWILPPADLILDATPVENTGQAKVEAAQQQAKAAQQQANVEKTRADRLAALLRAQGIDPVID